MTQIFESASHGSVLGDYGLACLAFLVVPFALGLGIALYSNRRLSLSGKV